MCRHKHPPTLTHSLTHTEHRKVMQFLVLRALRSTMHDPIRDHLAQKAREENDCTGSLEARNEQVLGDWGNRTVWNDTCWAVTANKRDRLRRSGM